MFLGLGGVLNMTVLSQLVGFWELCTCLVSSKIGLQPPKVLGFSRKIHCQSPVSNASNIAGKIDCKFWWGKACIGIGGEAQLP